LFPGGNAVGERLQFDKQEPSAPLYTVVGVAANVKNSGLAGEDEPEYYLLRRNRAEDWDRNGTWGRTSVIVIRTTLPSDAMSPWIRSQVAALDPSLPVDIATLHQRVSKLADTPRFRAVLVTCFAATGLLLAVMASTG
jgi:putative ABC transport system permease protein